MSILSEITTLVTTCDLPVETGQFTATPPHKYVVLTPLYDEFTLFADNRPGYDIQEVRVSLFVKGNYLSDRDSLVTALLEADFTITERRHTYYDEDTGYHGYSIDVSKTYAYTAYTNNTPDEEGD